MFAVCRGKVSEGIDFSDELCRAVFLVGIPYPPIQDKRITLKKEYIDKIFSDNSLNQFKKINS
jgi:regulator of telomere elongation helicase 1